MPCWNSSANALPSNSLSSSTYENYLLGSIRYLYIPPLLYLMNNSRTLVQKRRGREGAGGRDDAYNACMGGCAFERLGGAKPAMMHARHACGALQGACFKTGGICGMHVTHQLGACRIMRRMFRGMLAMLLGHGSYSFQLCSLRYVSDVANVICMCTHPHIIDRLLGAEGVSGSLSHRPSGV